MMIPVDLVRKSFFIFMAITAAALLLSIDQSMGAEDMVVAVDKSTLIKLIGLMILGILGEIWRNLRSIYKVLNGHGGEIKEIKGYCKGKNKDCGPGGPEAS